MGIKTLLPSEDDLPTSLVPCDTCDKGWPLNSLIYLELPTGETTNLCCWPCVEKYAKMKIKETL